MTDMKADDRQDTFKKGRLPAGFSSLEQQKNFLREIGIGTEKP